MAQMMATLKMSWLIVMSIHFVFLMNWNWLSAKLQNIAPRPKNGLITSKLTPLVMLDSLFSSFMLWVNTRKLFRLTSKMEMSAAGSTGRVGKAIAVWLLSHS